MQTLYPVTWAFHGSGRVTSTDPNASVSLGVSVGAIPGDDIVLVLISNETVSPVRVGFGGTATASSANLAGNAEREYIVPASLASTIAVKPAGGSGCTVSYQVFRALRQG